jgi:hypothetical protein
VTPAPPPFPPGSLAAAEAARARAEMAESWASRAATLSGVAAKIQADADAALASRRRAANG